MSTGSIEIAIQSVESDLERARRTRGCEPLVAMLAAHLASLEATRTESRTATATRQEAEVAYAHAKAEVDRAQFAPWCGDREGALRRRDDIEHALNVFHLAEMYRDQVVRNGVGTYPMQALLPRVARDSAESSMRSYAHHALRNFGNHTEPRLPRTSEEAMWEPFFAARQLEEYPEACEAHDNPKPISALREAYARRAARVAAAFPELATEAVAGAAE